MIKVIDLLIRAKNNKVNVDTRLDVGVNGPEWIVVSHQSIPVCIGASCPNWANDSSKCHYCGDY